MQMFSPLAAFAVTLLLLVTFLRTGLFTGV